LKAAGVRSAALVDEYCQDMRRMTLAHAHELMSFGIALSTITLVCPVPTLIRFCDKAGRRYCRDSSGHRAWVIPVTCVDPERPEEIEAADPIEVIGLGPVIDLIAFHPRAPHQFALRCGVVNALGAIEPQYMADPVRIFQDVTDWLKAACAGLMLLTPDAHEAGRVLRRIDIVEPATRGDEEHAAELRRLIALPAFRTLTTVAVRRLGTGAA
jgi:hypothetical protein